MFPLILREKLSFFLLSLKRTKKKNAAVKIMPHDFQKNNAKKSEAALHQQQRITVKLKSIQVQNLVQFRAKIMRRSTQIDDDDDDGTKITTSVNRKKKEEKINFKSFKLV